jgi:hypothetical protein
MSNWNEQTDRGFIDGVIRPLRDAVRLDDTFEMRVMSAVHSAALEQIDASHTEKRSASERESSGWNRKYSFSFSLPGLLAIAASVIGAVFLGSSLLARQADSSVSRVAVANTAAPAPSETHFILVNGSAQEVYLVGDFNGWAKTTTPLTRAVNGNAWAVSLPLAPGRHEYAFIVVDATGEKWVADPLIPAHEDEFGTESSVVSVASTPTSAAGS